MALPVSALYVNNVFYFISCSLGTGSLLASLLHSKPAGQALLTSQVLVLNVINF